jgi:hypothetical protein
MDDSAFESDMSGKKKSLRVYLINPPGGDNPWRSQGDYQQEQKEARERHAMFQGQHRLLQKSFRANMIAVSAAVLAAMATCFLVYFSYKAHISERARGKAQIEVWQRNTFYHGSNDERTKITFLFRNLSHRPTAIVDIYVREGESILEGRGYKDQIDLPIKIDPWDVREVEFRIEQNDEKRMNNILRRDIEDNEIVVNRGTGQTWTKTNSTSR